MLGDLGKIIVAKGFKKLPKVQKFARSGHTDQVPTEFKFWIKSFPVFQGFKQVENLLNSEW